MTLLSPSSTARESHTRSLLKRLFVALVLALLPSTAGIVVLAASPSTVTRTAAVERKAIPEATCKQEFPVLPAGASDWKSCRIETRMTSTTRVATPLASMLGVTTADAFDACAGTFYYQTNIYLGPLQIADAWFEWSYCWGSNYVQIVWGAYCGASGSALYGAGVNYCAYPHGADYYLPGVVKNSFYVSPYALPWDHFQGVQQELLYPGFWSYSTCWNSGNCH